MALLQGYCSRCGVAVPWEPSATMQRGKERALVVLPSETFHCKGEKPCVCPEAREEGTGNGWVGDEGCWCGAQC